MKSRNLFLGILILTIGVVALLASLGLFEFSWRIAWRLWPILLIFVGITILPVQDWLKALLLLVTLAIGVLLYHYEAKKGMEKCSSGWVNSARQWWDEHDDALDIF